MSPDAVPASALALAGATREDAGGDALVVAGDAAFKRLDPSGIALRGMGSHTLLETIKQHGGVCHH